MCWCGSRETFRSTHMEAKYEKVLDLIAFCLVRWSVVPDGNRKQLQTHTHISLRSKAIQVGTEAAATRARALYVRVVTVSR